jgi:hypothetical protein
MSQVEQLNITLFVSFRASTKLFGPNFALKVRPSDNIKSRPPKNPRALRETELIN